MVCGGTIDINESMTIGKCQYCETVAVIPQNLDKIGNLYNRANDLRRDNEFDKAIEIYEEILKENNNDAEAHFGLALSKYGIEYVEDDKTGKRVPTCHRVVEKPFLSDSDYIATLYFSDSLAKDVYEQEGARINEIQRKILNNAANEEQYSIFICYKETTKTGERTKESVLAQELYYELSKQYKVFFARKTLESKTGEEYEPLIFSALRSAKVMLVLGTSAENLSAVWVKNEWSRFLEMRKRDSTKILVPCYRDMSPEDLPNELSNLQSQDMGKLGFVQELSDRLGIIFRLPKDVDATVTVGKSENDADKMCLNAETFIKLGNPAKAKEIYEKMTEEDPSDYRGWWGIAKMNSKGFSYYESSKGHQIFEYMNYAMKVCGESRREELRSYYDAYGKVVERKFEEKEAKIKQCEAEMNQLSKVQTSKSTESDRLDEELDGLRSQKREQEKYLSSLNNSLGHGFPTKRLVAVAITILLYAIGVGTETLPVSGMWLVAIAAIPAGIGLWLYFTSIDTTKKQKADIDSSRRKLQMVVSNIKKTEEELYKIKKSLQDELEKTRNMQMEKIKLLEAELENIMIDHPKRKEKLRESVVKAGDIIHVLSNIIKHPEDYKKAKDMEKYICETIDKNILTMHPTFMKSLSRIVEIERLYGPQGAEFIKTIEEYKNSLT